MKLKSLLVCIFALLLAGCATSFYKDGHKVASFSGDMTNSSVKISESGAVEWSAAKVSHSRPTKAAGKIVVGAATAASAVVAPTYFK